MRWERLFGELEGHAEHARVEERDALVADLRQGEWAERSWIDGLPTAVVELDVIDVGVIAGRVRFANATVIHVEGTARDHLVATDAVRWARGATRGRPLAPDSVSARLGWGRVFRELQEDADEVRLALVGAVVVEGRVAVVGRDFVRLTVASGQERDIPMRSVRAVTYT